MDTATIAEVFDAAATAIEQNGWYGGKTVSGRWSDRGNLTCAGVALDQASDAFRVDRYEVWRYLAKSVGFDLSITSVVQWNDLQPDAETAIAKLREVAEKARSEA